MKTDYEPIDYGTYFELDTLLDCQKPLSRKYGCEAHEETLFVITHQVYELWFKMIIHDLDGVIATLNQDFIPEDQMAQGVKRLNRINKIVTHIENQLNILETMTPLEFLEFRDMFSTASGFQSLQFRQLMVKLGLPFKYQEAQLQHLASKDQEGLLALKGQPTLFDVVEKWLERTPFLSFGDFDFWSFYREAVNNMLDGDKEALEKHPNLLENQRQNELKEMENTRENFLSIFDETKHRQLVEKGERHISQKALQAALLINLYQDQPLFQAPHQVLTQLIDLDEGLTTWRYHHAQTALRMLGTKPGSGGSTGQQYLLKNVEKHKIFSDYFGLASFLIPKSKLPELPEELKKQLNYNYLAQ